MLQNKLGFEIKIIPIVDTVKWFSPSRLRSHHDVKSRRWTRLTRNKCRFVMECTFKPITGVNNAVCLCRSHVLHFQRSMKNDWENIWPFGKTGRPCGGRFSLWVRVHSGPQIVLLLHGSRYSSSTHHLAQGWHRALRSPIFPGSYSIFNLLILLFLFLFSL